MSRDLENRSKIDEKIDANSEIEKKRPKNPLKAGFGRVLDSIWEGFGTVLAVFLALLGAFWAFFGCSKIIFFQSWLNMVPKLTPRGLQHRFWDLRGGPPPSVRDRVPKYSYLHFPSLNDQPAGVRGDRQKK